MTLKTLKDMESYEISDYEIIEDAILISNLKQEAIKWVKYFNKLETAEDMIYEKDWETIFKKFHNITEEDLMTNEEINAREHGEIGNN